MDYLIASQKAEPERKARTGCTLCPRRCSADRTRQKGRCGGGSIVRLARAALHFWEEPCISGDKGSGTVFFSGCPLQCCYCQNYTISAGNFGQEVSIPRLAAIFLELQEQGAHNINLVNPTHYVPWIIEALDLARPKLDLPVVYNSGGYEQVETIRRLNGYVDVYLPDIKYRSDALAEKYSAAAGYFEAASRAVPEMARQVGPPVFDQAGMLKRGVLIRHLVLPGAYRDSLSILDWIGATFGTGQVLISLMSQYTPGYQAHGHKELERRITTFEYGKVTGRAAELGLQGYTQEKSSAQRDYTPSFNLEGI